MRYLYYIIGEKKQQGGWQQLRMRCILHHHQKSSNVDYNCVYIVHHYKNGSTFEWSNLLNCSWLRMNHFPHQEEQKLYYSICCVIVMGTMKEIQNVD